MFESVLYQLLAGYLGHYIKDINREHFRLGLWSGEALLENVEIRLAAFDFLQLPFSIKQGSVGKLRLQVPWSKIGWEPILIALDGVTLLAGPHEESEYAAEASERRALAAKKAGLAAAEIAKLSQRVSEDKSGETFLSCLLAKMIDNVQVNVTNVHIQYVDGKTDPGRVFAFGITLSSLTISTTDGRDHPVLPGLSAGVKGGTNHHIYKIVESKELAVYWNSDIGPVFPAGSSVGIDGSSSVHSLLGKDEKVFYLLHPTNATIRLTVDKSVPIEGVPHYSVAADVDDLAMALEDQQLIQMLLLMDVFSMSRLRERYARYQPQVSESNYDKAEIRWQRRLWAFAIQSVLADVRKQLRGSSWRYFSWRSDRQKRYVSLYKEKLDSLQRVQAAGDHKWAELEEMEREFEMDEILYFRSLAERQFHISSELFGAANSEYPVDGSERDCTIDTGQKHEAQTSQQSLSQQRGWLNWLSLGLLGAAESIDAAVCPDEIIKDLCEAAADFNPVIETGNGKSLRGHCRLLLSVCVRQAFGSLISSSTTSEIVNISVGGTLVTFTLWQASSSLFVTIPTLEVMDPCTSEVNFSRILTRKAQRIPWNSSTIGSQNLDNGGPRVGSVFIASDNLFKEGNSPVLGNSSAENSTQQMASFVKVEVDLKNKTQDFEITVDVTIQPLEFVYSPPLVDRVLDFFSQPNILYTRHELVTSCPQKLESIAGHTRAKAEFAFATRKRVGWHIDIQRPTLLLRERNPVLEGMFMIGTWESLIIASAEFQCTAPLNSDMEAAQRLWDGLGSTRCYERLEVRLVGAEVIIVEQSSNWQERLVNDIDLRSHLLERFNLQVAVCWLPSDPTKMAHVKMAGEIASLHWHVSAQKCSLINAIVTDILECQKKIKKLSFYGESDEFAYGGGSAFPIWKAQTQTDTQSEGWLDCQIRVDMPTSLELNVTLGIFTVKLAVDEELGPVHENMTFIAQAQDTSLRYTSYDSQEELQLKIGTAHIEDENELEGSSTRYLVFHRDAKGSVSKIREKSSERIYLSSSESISRKSCFVGKINRYKTNKLIWRLDFSLQGLDCHCHPKVIRAFYAFSLVVAKTNAAAGSGNGQSKHQHPDKGLRGYDVASDRPILDSGAPKCDNLTDATLVFGVQIKDVSIHMYDPGGMIAILILSDAKLSMSSSAYTKDILKTVVVFREFRLKGPKWACGTVAGDLLGNSSHGAAATLNAVISKVGKRKYNSGLEYKVIEVDVAVRNAQCILLNDYFAMLIGCCMSSEWRFSTKDSTSPKEVLGNVMCLDSMKSIYLCKLEFSNSIISLPLECNLLEYLDLSIPKLVVSFIPGALAEYYGVETELTSNYSSSRELTDVVFMEGQEITMSLHDGSEHLKAKDVNHFRLIDKLDGTVTLKLPISKGFTSMKTDSSSSNPIFAELDFSALYFNLAGTASLKGVELLMVYQKELSSISWKYKAYASIGFQHGCRDRSPFNHLDAPPASDSLCNLNCRISKLICLLRAPEAPFLMVASLRAESSSISLSLCQGKIEILNIETQYLDLSYGLSLKKLLHVSSGDVERNSLSDNLIPLFFLAKGELSLALPCTKVWLHVAAWTKVISSVAAVFTSSSSHEDGTSLTMTSRQASPGDGQLVTATPSLTFPPSSEKVGLQSSKVEILFDEISREKSKVAAGRVAEFALEPRSGRSEIKDLKSRPLQINVGMVNVAFILPDYKEDVKSLHLPSEFHWENGESQMPGAGQQSGQGNILENNQEWEAPVNSRTVEKQIILSWSVRVDEIRLNSDGRCTFTAYIMQVEGFVEENSGEGQNVHVHFLLVKDIMINGQISSREEFVKENLKFSVEVNSVDVWCSYTILQFLSTFHLEQTRSGSSSSLPELYCSVEIHLQSCLLVLSDSRWSCNAPMIEILLGKVATQFACKNLDMEASLSSAMEINYHNIEKVEWEPLVEPWNVCCKITREQESNNTSKPFWTRVQLTSAVPLNINVTEALIQAISRAVEMIRDSWKQEICGDASVGVQARDPQAADRTSVRRYAPYWLQNDTGVPLKFWFCGAPSNKENNEDANSRSFGTTRSSWGSTFAEVVQPGYSVPLYAEESPDEIFLRRRAGHSTDGYNARKIFSMLLLHRMICVQLEGTARPSVPISIDLVGSICFEAVFSDGDCGDGGSRPSQGSFQEAESERRGSFSTHVIVEVTVQRYSKLVRLCSMVSLVNSTSVALELRFDIPFLISPKVMDPILPGHVMALPVHLAETGRMRWRPVGNNHLWSEVQSLPNFLLSAETHSGFHRPVVCYPFHPSNGAFRCCIAVENDPIRAAEALSASNTRDRRDIIGFNRISNNLCQGLSSSSDEIKGGTSWDIILKAPLVFKNCLPCSLAMTIETGAGIVSNFDAPEGDSLFVYDVDTTQDLSLTFTAPSYLPTSVKLASGAPFSSDFGHTMEQNLKITFTQELNFKPEATSYASVSVEMETDIDTVSGARELRISAPFWLYNCSYLNLAVMDGDVDVYSGRELPLGDPTYEERAEEMSLHSTKARSWPVVVNGLQIALEMPQPDGVVKRSSSRRVQSEKASMWRSSPHMKLDGEAGENPLRRRFGLQEQSMEEKTKNCMHMYSPVQGTDASELHLRARIKKTRPTDSGTDLGEKYWSRPFLLEPPGGATMVAIPQPEGNGAFLVAVISAPALGSCAGKTKTVTFRPRFLLANVSKEVLCYRQQGTDQFQRLERGRHSQLHWHDVGRELLISVRIDEHGWDWSGGFSPDQLGDTQVKVRNHTTGTMHMLRVEVSSMLASAGGAQGAGPAGGSLGTCLVMLSDDETGFIPYRIENFTLERLRFHQQRCEKMENMLQPYSSCGYAWDEPCRPHRLVIEVPGAGDLGAFWLDEVKEYPVITLPATSEKPERRWLVHVRAEGPIRVLSIVDGTVHTLKGPTAIEGSMPGDQFGKTGQNVEPNSGLFEEFTVKLSYVGVSIIDNYPQEIVYGCAKGFNLQFLHCQHQHILKVDVAWFQVDNQLRYAVYPVMLSVSESSPKIPKIMHVPGRHPNPAENQVSTGNPLGSEDVSAFSLSIAKWRNPTGSVDCFQYINMRLGPLRLELEERVVSCLLHLMDRVSWSFSSADTKRSVTLKSQPWSVLCGSLLYEVSVQPFISSPWKYDMIHIPTSNMMRFTKAVKQTELYHCWASAVAVEPIIWQSQKLFLFAKEKRKAYIETLHVAPIVLTVSFSSAPWLANEIGGSATRSLLWMTGTLLQRQVRALADVEGAPVHLRQLKLAHPFASWDVIQGMITRHYTRQLLQEVYKVLGSADVFGNPVGFIRSMASGMWEFISAPTRSSVQSPTELVRGFEQGTRSLFANTVFAFSNAATRMSRAARKGVTVFTMDSEYYQEMDRLLQLEGSQEISVVNEFLEGLTGLLQAPISGAERHGLPGMLSGMALGAVGVVARPVASILEVAGMTAQSIRNRTRPAQWHAARVRLPRHVNNYSPLLLYSWERAVGQAVLLEAEGGRFKNEVYFTCKPLVQEGRFLILTESKILKVSNVSFASTTAISAAVHSPKWKLDLDGAIDDVLNIDQVGNEVSLLLGPPLRPLVGPHLGAGVGSKYTTRFTPFAYETFELLTESAALEFLDMVRLLEGQHQQVQWRLLLASSKSISCPKF